jgi:hypothetical protein
MKWLSEKEFVKLLVLYTGFVGFISSMVSYFILHGLKCNEVMSLAGGAVVGLAMGAILCYLLVYGPKPNES